MVLLTEFLVHALNLMGDLLNERLNIYGREFLFKSQESLMTFLYGYSIVKTNPKLLGKIFIDYPLELSYGARNKVDLYIDVKPGYYIEVKYIRPIPSGMCRPLPQHRGTIIGDVVKLVKLVPKNSHKFVLLISDRAFINHLVKKPGFPILNKEWSGKISELITNKTEMQQVKTGSTILEKHLSMVQIGMYVANDLHILLWKISESRS